MSLNPSMWGRGYLTGPFPLLHLRSGGPGLLASPTRITSAHQADSNNTAQPSVFHRRPSATSPLLRTGAQCVLFPLP